MVYYAVANGRETGIFSNWADCNLSVKGYKNALFKKFDTIKEANEFIFFNKEIILDNTKVPLQLNDEFIADYYVYTDGACSNNGKTTALSGIGIFFRLDDSRNVSKKIEGLQTNNVAELTAIIETYFIIEPDICSGKKIAIVTDSEYAIKCVSTYGEKCHNTNWVQMIPNKDLVKKAYDLYKNRSNIKFIHVKAHTNNTDMHSIGNYNADKLAQMSIEV
jgi:ribonuclease HI